MNFKKHQPQIFVPIPDHLVIPPKRLHLYIYMGPLLPNLMIPSYAPTSTSICIWIPKGLLRLHGKVPLNLIPAGSSILAIHPTAEGYGLLTREEVVTCEILRIFPTQYLHIKKTLLNAVATYGPFKKREAQTWFRIDVNKVPKLLIADLYYLRLV